MTRSVHVTAANETTVSIQVDERHHTMTWPELDACAQQSDRELARTYAAIRDAAAAIAGNWYRGIETVLLPLPVELADVGVGIYRGQYVVEMQRPGSTYWDRKIGQWNGPRSWHACAHDVEERAAENRRLEVPRPDAMRIRQVSCA